MTRNHFNDAKLTPSFSRLDWTGSWFNFQALVFRPGYYKTNYRALRLREMFRWYGWYRGLREWLKTRFKPPSARGTWMPGLWAENECQPEDLSAGFWQATKPHRADFEKLGFVQCHLLKRTKSLNPHFLDSGNIFYLDATRCYFGQLLYSRHYLPSRNREVNNIIIAFTAAFEHGSLCCTNHRTAFDSPRTSKVIRLNSYDVPVIYQRFQEELRRRSDKPRPFPTLESLREWFDARQIEDFEDRARRRLFIPMTEPEIKAAWAVLQSGTRTTLAPLPRRGFRFEFWPTIILFLVLLLLSSLVHRHPPTGGNTIAGNVIEYQGQQFKMSQSYATYEDYKDDPNNLDTNELGRIEQTMESVKIPASFKDPEDSIHFIIFDLGFPGYGVGGIGANTQTDDGSTLDAESVEIPQANKDRVIVVRESGSNMKVLDDFIYDNSGTNEISRVQLEHQQLQYFDQTGRLFRKKSL